MLRKYTRANRKLFGLRFHEPLFGGRTAGRWDLRDPGNLEDPALCSGVANVRATNESCEEQGAPRIPNQGAGSAGAGAKRILGSVAERVMREAECPVLTMRTK